MLKTEVQTGLPGAFEQIAHHAEPMRPLAQAFVEAVVDVLAADDELWILRQSKTGARSWGLHAPNGMEFHIRSDCYDPPQIDIYDSYYHGAHVITLTSATQIRRWMDRIVVQGSSLAVPVPA